ncbi:hypothetical protein GCM10010399_45400 [Dactylosporangium fulvum]
MRVKVLSQAVSAVPGRAVTRKAGCALSASSVTPTASAAFVSGGVRAVHGVPWWQRPAASAVAVVSAVAGRSVVCRARQSPRWAGRPQWSAVFRRVDGPPGGPRPRIWSPVCFGTGAAWGGTDGFMIEGKIWLPRRPDSSLDHERAQEVDLKGTA